MSDDTQAQIRTESELVEKGNELLAKLQEALSTFGDVMTALADHKIDGDSHPDIRNLIQSIVTGTGFVTVDQANVLINDAIAAHDTSVASHPGLKTLLEQLQLAFNDLKTRVDILDPPPSTDPLTQLNLALKAIDAKYDPIIAALQQAYNAAVIGDTGTSDAIAANIQAETLAKANARYEVMKEYGYYA